MSHFVRFALLMTAWLLTLGSAFAQSPLDKDERLNVSITLHHHVVCLSDLVRDLQRQTGVPMEAQRDIMDEKATVFVENKLAREVMEKLASVFLLRWEKRKPDGYRLTPDADARKWERDFLALRERIADRLWLEWIQKGYRDAQKGRRWIAQRIEDLNRSEQRLREQGVEEQQLEKLFAERERLGTVYPPYSFLAVQVLGRTPLLAWERLKRGEILVASTQPGPGEFPLTVSEDALREILNEHAEPSLGELRFVRIQLMLSEEWLWDSYVLLRDTPGAEYFEAMSPRLDVSVTLRFERGVKRIGGVVRPPVSSELLRPISKHPLVTRWQQWQTPAQILLEEPVLSRPFDRSRPSYPLRGYFGELTDADLFCWFHTVTGVPIIADGSRLIRRHTSLPAHTPGRWLAVLAESKENEAWDGYFIRYEDGYVLARRRAYLDLRQWEIPERLILTLEAKVLKGEMLTLEDFAWLAAQITDRQVRVLPVFFFGLMQTIATRFDQSNLGQQDVYMLRLWASLSPAQKRALWEGERVLADELSPAQQQLLWHALKSKGQAEYLLEGGWRRTDLRITAEEDTFYLLRDRGEMLLPVTGRLLKEHAEQGYSDAFLHSFMDLWGSPALRSCRGIHVRFAIGSGEEEVASSVFLLRTEPLPPLDPPGCLWHEMRTSSTR